jgi:hypothetical protein
VDGDAMKHKPDPFLLLVVLALAAGLIWLVV